MTLTKTIALVAVAGVSLTTFGSTLSASAATNDWPSTRPYIEYVGGECTESTGVTTSDPRPEFTVSWDASNSDGVLRILDAEDRLICEGEVTDGYWAPGHLFACSATRDLAYGQNDLHAVIESPDGTQRSGDSDVMPVFVTIPSPTIEIDRYDAATKTLTVHGTAPRAETVGVTARAGGPVTPGALEADGSWNAVLTGVQTGNSITVTAKRGSAVASGDVFLADLSAPEAPQVTSRVTGGLVRLTVEGAESDKTYSVKNERGAFVAGGSAHDDPGFTFRDPGHEAHYFVTAQRNGVDSQATVVVVNSGLGDATPPAPKVDQPLVSGYRAVVPVTGKPGATATIRDAAGTVVTVRSLGPSGVAQLPLTLPASRTGTFSVTQSSNEATSAETRFRL